MHCRCGVWQRKGREKGRQQSSGLTPCPALGQEQRVLFQDAVASKTQQPEGFLALSTDHLLPWPHSAKGLSILSSTGFLGITVKGRHAGASLVWSQMPPSKVCLLCGLWEMSLHL